MCGIAGIVAKNGISEPRLRALPTALERLRHRGPDDRGFLSYANGEVRVGREAEASPGSQVVFLHTRLSILDLTNHGWQPMGADGRYFLIFNGEIYNHVELRQELESLGHVFHSRSDTEVLLKSYIHWGPAALTRLVGMFAFAILDAKERIVFLARDFFGIKPLYYFTAPGCFVFASEIKALLELRSTERFVNPERLYLYLRFGISDHGSDTLLSGIHQLPPASCLRLSLEAPEEVTPIAYWNPCNGELSDASFEEASERLRDLFLDSVRLHMRSDVPIGTALSGGIDSSSIIAAMRCVDPSAELHAFSYIAEDSEITEEHWIDMAAAAARAQVHRVHAEASDIVADLEPLTFAQDEPFGSTSLYAQYCVFRSARDAGIKVMLDGQGADEMLGGYRYYISARFASLVRHGKYQEALDFLLRSSRWSGTRASWLLLRAGSFLFPPAIQQQLRKLVGKEVMPGWLNEQWFARHGVAAHSFGLSHGSDVLRECLCQELTSSSLPHLLRYEDRNSMAFSIESRVPFLTPQLVRFVLSLPENYLVAEDGSSKAVFRKAMRGIVPDAILDRRDKVAFATPERKWLTTLSTWVQRLLSSDMAQTIPAFHADRLKNEWRLINRGRRGFDFRVWRWLNTIHWAGQFGVQFD